MSDLENRIERLERRMDAFAGVRNNIEVGGLTSLTAPGSRDRRLAELEELLDRMCGVIAEADIYADRYRRRHKRNDE